MAMKIFLKWALTYIYYIYGQHIGPTLLCCACRKTIICIFFCLENFPNIQLWKYTPAASWRKNEKNSNYISPVCLKSPFVWGPDRHQNSTIIHSAKAPLFSFHSAKQIIFFKMSSHALTCPCFE